MFPSFYHIKPNYLTFVLMKYIGRFFENFTYFFDFMEIKFIFFAFLKKIFLLFYFSFITKYQKYSYFFCLSVFFALAYSEDVVMDSWPNCSFKRAILPVLSSIFIAKVLRNLCGVIFDDCGIFEAIAYFFTIRSTLRTLIRSPWYLPTNRHNKNGSVVIGRIHFFPKFQII